MSISDTCLWYADFMDKKLQDFLNKNNYFFIHYASDGFYNGSSPAPKISCIVIFNDKTTEKFRFCPVDYLKENSKEEAERLCLNRFKEVIESKPNICFIHWNMNSDGFGFKAISARAKELGIEFPQISNENLFDLSSYVAYIAEKKLSLKQVLWFNSLLDREFLDGKTEAEYSKLGKYEEIFESVNLKTAAFSMIVEEIKHNTLKTEKPFAEPNDGLTKEERRARALKIEAAREEMLQDIVNHNKLVLQKRQKALDKFLEKSNIKAEKTVDKCLDDFEQKYEQQNKEFIEKHFEKLESEAESQEQEYEEEHSLFFFDFKHPLLSLFANWFGNK